MMKDGKILYLEPGAISSLRTAGDARSDPLSRDTVFRDIKGLDNLVWQHLLDCAARVAALEATWPPGSVKPEPKTWPICATCGSDDVRADAYAAWSMGAQEWELTATFDKGAVCEKCGEECSLEWAEEGEDNEQPV